MASVVELEQRLEALRAARATGALSVRLADGRMTVFRSDADMATAAADLERQITVASGVPVSTVLVASGKGLE